jgi:flagellar basal body rod protein FlgC
MPYHETIPKRSADKAEIEAGVPYRRRNRIFNQKHFRSKLHRESSEVKYECVCVDSGRSAG